MVYKECNKYLVPKEQGTIIVVGDDAVAIEFDKSAPSRHDCDGIGKKNHCRWIFNSGDLRIINEESLDYILGLNEKR